MTGVLGGAAQGSSWCLMAEIELFIALKVAPALLQWTDLDGLDLGVEEAMLLPCAIRLIDRLRKILAGTS